MSGQLVLVTGASGYIATHVVKLLLTQGYRVRGTVRSLTNETKVKPLRDMCPNAQYPLELVEADLNEEASWAAATKDCVYIHHTASPFPLENPANEDELIKPAVNGTLCVLQACGESVKRVILTSSIVAVNNAFQTRDHPWTEEDWTDPNTAANAYVKSKVLAEKAAWDYVKSLPVEKRFELAVINPAFVMGPMLCGTAGTSMMLPRMMMKREGPAFPPMGSPMVDVRDVALGHINAMTIPESAGHRHILAPESKMFKEVALLLDEEFRPQGYNVLTREMPNFVARFMGLFVAQIKEMLPALGQPAVFDCTRMRNTLSIKPRDFKNTILDMAYSMIEAGHLDKSDKYTGPKYSEKFP